MIFSSENSLFFLPFLSGIAFLISGLLLFKFPGKKPNGIYGYRTARSMKNQQNWEFAQRYSGQELIKMAAILFLSAAIGSFFILPEGLAVGIGLTLLICITMVLFVRVEKAIRKQE